MIGPSFLARSRSSTMATENVTAENTTDATPQACSGDAVTLGAPIIATSTPAKPINAAIILLGRTCSPIMALATNGTMRG